MKKLFFALAFSMAGLMMPNLWAQHVNISLSPQAALNQAMMNHNINEFSGLPDIRIPLYTIDLDGLEIPIDLVYNGRGIKYRQFDGEIAAGWGLSIAGYQITRQIYGYPDDKALDTNEPDIYRYHIPGSNGVFTVDRNLSHEKVTRTTDLIRGITNHYLINILNGNGFEFKFRNGWGGRIDSFISTYGGCPTNWMLETILSPLTDNKVNIYYGEMSVYTDAVWQDCLTVTSRQVGTQTPTHSYSVERGTPIYTKAEYISKIVTSKETIEFSRNPKGIVQWIRIKNLSGVTVKKITFRYEDYSNHRLLTEVLIGNESENNQKYQFDYNKPNLDMVNKSYPDTWGYYSYSTSFLPPSLQGLQPKIMALHDDFLNEKVSGVLTIRHVLPELVRYGAPRNNINSSAVNWFSLRSITYPTGGTTTYSYESNKTNYYTGGGQRVRRITTQSPGDSHPYYIEYEYGNTSTLVDNYVPNGRGRVATEMNGLQYFSQVITNTSGNTTITTRKYTMTPSFTDASFYDIYYSHVTKKEYCGSNYLGKTVSLYELPQEMLQYKTDVGMNIYNYYLGISPVLKKRKIYDRNGVVQTEEIYTITETRPYRRTCQRNEFQYNIYSHIPIITESEVLSYDAQGLNPLRNTTTYLYDSSNRIIQSTFNKSEGGSVLMKYVYPQGRVEFQGLQYYNMGLTPIRTQCIIDGRDAGIVDLIYEYGAITNWGLPRRPTQIMYSPRGLSELRVIKTMKYEKGYYGNLVEYTDYNEGSAGIVKVPHVVYYSYNNQYPIAVATGLTSSQMQQFGAANLLPASNAINPSSSQIISAVERLNSMTSGLASVSGTSYIPLVGVDTEIDGTGRKTYYSYDAFGQLESIRDDKFYLVKEFEHNVSNK